ncbi:S-layer homology domain-containing protein [Paenibacillus sp. HN-1]|uniref:S-layer homology domain-containing protein n=1 Tax=Paenibacillus TaxID=44249 RepID=UPI001CA951E6|nr:MULTISPECIES: S-layer homology domain-containing protein [Paenibacillus]MBY9077569.1 S-layer homology domain-containing protein [Paenibacillus sp. CGMCC 1.18879]MBY9087840.1 S-layer homology domain-containing protein [Paenibacillus sinensis]
MSFKWKQAFAAIALTSTMAFAYAADVSAETTETIPAWASEEIESWKNLGLLKGDQVGRILPNDGIKKTEFVALINRIFNFNEISGQTFDDVPSAAWYAPEIGKAVAAGAIIGSGDGKINPLETLTREQAALILSRVFQVTATEPVSASFSDDSSISVWAKEAIYAMKEAGYVAGTPSGAFLPQKSLTRAEAVKMINNAMGALVSDGANHANMAGGNLIVNTAGATLSNLNLTGSLYITPGVGEGDLNLVNARIGGVVYVNGGGTHSITLTDSAVNHMQINKPKAPVRVVFKGSASANAIDVSSESVIVNESGNAIGSLRLLTNGGKAVSLYGNVKQLNMNGKSSFTLESGRVDGLNVSKEAGGSKIQLAKDTTVGSIIFDAATTVTGTGKIQTAIINSPGVSLPSMPDKLIMNVDTVIINGQTIDRLGNVVTSSSTGTGGTAVTDPSTGEPVTENPVTEEPEPQNPVTEEPEPEKPVTEEPVKDKATELYSYAGALGSFASTGAEGTVKQYLTFLQDPSYNPSIANSDVDMPDLVNAITLVNYQFTVKPSLFASLRGVNTSVLNDARTYLWIGTNNGVTRIQLSTNEMKSYTTADRQLTDDKVLLLISDGGTGVFAITATGVSHIYQ